MAAPRAFPPCRALLYRGFATPRATGPALLSSRIALSQRQFTSGTRFLQAADDSQPITEEEAARSIAIVRLPRHAVKSEIEEFVKKAGVDIKRTQLRLDRFTFHNDTFCTMELGSQEEAQAAVEKLNGKNLLDTTVYVRSPLRPDFIWSKPPPLEYNSSGSRFFYQSSASSPAEAIRPLLEGRRLLLSVMTPGWGGGDVKTRNEAAREVLAKHFGKHGIESVGGLSPFYGDLKPEPRMLCLLDFETKDGAENAMKEFHDQDVEGRKVWLRRSESAPWRAHHFGKVDPGVLKALQEKGIAPLEIREDQKLSPIKKQEKEKKQFKGKKPKKQTQ